MAMHYHIGAYPPRVVGHNHSLQGIGSAPVHAHVHEGVVGYTTSKRKAEAMLAAFVAERKAKHAALIIRRAAERAADKA